MKQFDRVSVPRQLIEDVIIMADDPRVSAKYALGAIKEWMIKELTRIDGEKIT